MALAGTYTPTHRQGAVASTSTNITPAPSPTPFSETRTVALSHINTHKLTLRPVSFRAAISEAATLFDLDEATITLQVQVGQTWYEVMENAWDTPTLTKTDPMPLKVYVDQAKLKRQHEKEACACEGEVERPTKESTDGDLREEEGMINVAGSKNILFWVSQKVFDTFKQYLDSEAVRTDVPWIDLRQAMSAIGFEGRRTSAYAWKFYPTGTIENNDTKAQPGGLDRKEAAESIRARYEHVCRGLSDVIFLLKDKTVFT
ncbi:hypothetical protein P7C70_g7458, partial [Phenoliferia sp. Uapishka_3]